MDALLAPPLRLMLGNNSLLCSTQALLKCHVYSIAAPTVNYNWRFPDLFANRLRRQRVCQHGFPGLLTSKIQGTLAFVSLYFRLKLACSFASYFMQLMRTSINAHLSYVATVQSASWALYIVLYDLKPLIEDSNLQRYMYCVHAWEGASGAPRTHFRACKSS